MAAAQTERAPAMGVAPPLAPEPPPPRRQAPVGEARAALWWPTLLIAAVLCLVTFYAKGGLNPESMTATEMGLTLGGAVAIGAVVLLAPAGGRAYGLWPVLLLVVFTVLTIASVVWSVAPDASWRDADRMLAYTTVFAAACALVRVVPERWPALLGGVTLAATAICSFALLTKVFPGDLVPAGTYARLQEPYGYWNATGLTAALGVTCCLWLGARRSGHALLNALAYPAAGIMLLALALAYSRGALAALAVGVLAWFCLVPLRLRSATLLLVSGLGAGAVAGWAFSRNALSAEGVGATERAAGGHELGALIAAMVLLLALAGVAIGFLSGRRPPTLALRRNAGAMLVALVVLAIVAFAGALAHSHRGFTGSISHAVDSLTNPDAKPPPNTPDRLTAVASVRARYWKEALQIFAAHPALGVGASGYQTARLRYRHEALEVRHAHGFAVQTLADLGLAGLAIALALLLTWMAATGRCTHPFDRRWSGWPEWRGIRSGARPGWRRWPEPYSPERVGMLAMLTAVVVFGVHSLVDWTWYVPGDACVALLFAGWLAGRGPLGPPVERRGPRAEPPPAGPLPAKPPPAEPLLAGSPPAGLLPALRRDLGRLRELPRVRVAIATGALVGGLLAGWSQWQPQRAEDARQQALAVLARDPRAALGSAETAVSRDPLSAEALLTLAHVQQTMGNTTVARATLQRAVRLQPSDPQTWLALGRYDLASQPAAALREIEAAIYLNPESISPEALASDREAVETHNLYIEALRASSAASLSSASEPRVPASSAGGRFGR